MLFPWFSKPQTQVLSPDDIAQMRIAQTIPWQTEPFPGFGDASDARQTSEALTGAVSTGVRAIRQRIQGLRLGVFARRFINGEVDDQPAFNHPLQILLDSPTLAEDGSITHSASQLWGLVVSHYLMFGESYLVIIHNGAGVPMNLQMMQPGTLEPVVKQGRNVGYRLTSRGSGQGPRDRDLLPKDVIRVWDPDTFELHSSSGVMQRNSSIINANTFVASTNEKFYKNNATPLLAFESQGTETQSVNKEDQEAGSLSWIRRLNNRIGRRQGAPPFSPLGWKLTQLSSEAESSNRVAMMTYSDRRVWQALGTPASILGDVVDANRAAADTNRHVFDTNTILPITLTIAEALTDQLARHYPQNGDSVRLIVKFLPFIAPDRKFELEKDIADATNKIRSVDEIRSHREPALPVSGWGEFPVGTPFEVPYLGEVETAIDLSGLGLGLEDEETEEDRSVRGAIPATFRQLRDHFSKEKEWERAIVREARFTPAFKARQKAVFDQQGRDVVRRYLKSQRAHPTTIEAMREGWLGTTVRAAADDITDEIMPLAGWERLFSVIVPVREAAFVASATEATTAITGEVFSMTDTAAKLLRTQNRNHYKFVNESTRNSLNALLAKAIEAGDPIDKTARDIGALFGTRKKDATRIARTEIAGAVQEAQVEGFEQTGVVEGQTWNTSLDDRVRDSHTINGQTVRLGEDFTLDDGETTPSPAHPSLSAGNRINCRCFVTPTFVGEDLEAGVGAGISGFAA